MKRSAMLLIAVVAVLFGGCVGLSSGTETTENTADFNTTSIVIENTSEFQIIAPETSWEQNVYITEMQTADAPVTEAPEVSSQTEISPEESTVDDEKTTREEDTAWEEKTTREEKTTAHQSVSDVDLSISMPEKNGTMETDSSPDNKYIKIVNKEKKIDASLLLAVYSVPESGQNYVFEFYDADDFSADNIRRVYLIDSYGDITSIAAAESSEKENISPVENWFCMNVLIKEIIYPAVSGDR